MTTTIVVAEGDRVEVAGWASGPDVDDEDERLIGATLGAVPWIASMRIDDESSVVVTKL